MPQEADNFDHGDDVQFADEFDVVEQNATKVEPQQSRLQEVQRSNIAKLRELGSIQQLSNQSEQMAEELFAVTALDKNKKKTNRKGFLALRDGHLMYLKDSDKVFDDHSILDVIQC